MNLKTVKYLLLSVLVCSAIFAVTIVSIDLYAFHAKTDKLTNYMHNGNTATLTYISKDTVSGRYTLCGDEVGGGHP